MRLLLLLLSFAFIIDSSQAQVIDTLILVEEHSVFFNSDAWELNDKELKKIDSLITLTNESDQILLEGHTDKVGSEKYNQILSAKRVKHIKDRFLQLGIAENKITSKRYGELKPAIKGEDESAYKLNRRVTIQYYKLEKRRKLKGSVVEEETQESLIAKIKITGIFFKDSTVTNMDGSFSIAVPDNTVYKLEISADNHFFEQRFIKVSPVEIGDIKVSLPEISIGSIYTLPNFNFKGDLPILLKRSIPTLDLLFELMHNSDICIEIKGHINLPNQADCAKDTWHYKLSVDRAQRVYVDMVSKGIASDRMVPKGYGNWEMLFPKANTQMDMEKNRRVEIKIIDCNNKELHSENQK